MGTIVILGMVSTTSACAMLPHVGPSKRQIEAGAVQQFNNSHIVQVDDAVTRETSGTPPLAFSSAFKRAGTIGADTIRPGDTLSLTIWENVDDGLLANQGANFTPLDGVQVDDDGYIFVPYAGRIKAAGNTPDEIRKLITAKLADQTPDPQVEVQRTEGDGATVVLGGDIATPGVLQIKRPTRKLSAVLSAAGGPTVNTDIAQVTVTRGSQRSTIWYQDIFNDPRNDIALRNGDRIMVQGDPRTFTVLGATGRQGVVSFDTEELSAIEALARAGGLQTNAADPRGIFVFRTEAANVADAVLNRSDFTTPQRMVYVLNLDAPNGMFLAKDFEVRDGDIIYVTEAPFTQWNKTIATLTGSLSSASTVSSLSDLGD